MPRVCLQVVVAALITMAVACTKRQQPVAVAPLAAPPPAPAPAPPHNMVVLMPDPTGKNTAIVVTNGAGTQEIHEADHAVRVERADVPPSAPIPIDQSTVKRVFGAALDVMPDPEARFILYFDEASDTLNSEAQATITAIMRAVQERHSTDISVTGHTDRTGTTQRNYELGLRRAERVAAVLRAQGVEDDSLFIKSHGESDPLINTGAAVAEQRNRRVEVIVH